MTTEIKYDWKTIKPIDHFFYLAAVILALATGMFGIYMLRVSPPIAMRLFTTALALLFGFTATGLLGVFIRANDLSPFLTSYSRSVLVSATLVLSLMLWTSVPL